MNQAMHTHYYMGETSFDDGHTHRFRGETSPSPDFPGHTHLLMGDTSVDDRHRHEYRISTSRQIAAGGGHYHDYNADTEYAHGHVHAMRGFTSVFSM